MGTNRIKAVLCVLIASSLLAVPACRNQKTESGAAQVPPPGGIKGDLGILSATPRGGGLEPDMPVSPAP